MIYLVNPFHIRICFAWWDVTFSSYKDEVIINHDRFPPDTATSKTNIKEKKKKKKLHELWRRACLPLNSITIAFHNAMDFPIGVSPISCLNFPSHKTRRSRKESPISGPSVSAVHGHTIRSFFSGIGRDTSAYPRPTAVCGVCPFTFHVLWIGVKDDVVFTEFRKLFWRSFGSDHYHGPIRTGIAIVFPTSIWIRHGEMHMAKKLATWGALFMVSLCLKPRQPRDRRQSGQICSFWISSDAWDTDKTWPMHHWDHTKRELNK